MDVHPLNPGVFIAASSHWRNTHMTSMINSVRAESTGVIQVCMKKNTYTLAKISPADEIIFPITDITDMTVKWPFAGCAVAQETHPSRLLGDHFSQVVCRVPGRCKK